MSFDRILLIGASGHGKVVIDTLLCANPSMIIELVDDDARKHDQILHGLKIGKAPIGTFSNERRFHVAVGHNGSREKLSDGFSRQGLIYQSILHCRAYVAMSANIGDGVFLAAQSVVGPESKIERGCVINHGSVVDHDCVVGDFSHIAPNATLGGNVKIGKRVLIGAGATVLPGVSIGDDCIVGAGAVVLKNLIPASTYIGVSARELK